MTGTVSIICRWSLPWVEADEMRLVRVPNVTPDAVIDCDACVAVSVELATKMQSKSFAAQARVLDAVALNPVPADESAPLTRFGNRVIAGNVNASNDGLQRIGGRARKTDRHRKWGSSDPLTVSFLKTVTRRLPTSRPYAAPLPPSNVPTNVQPAGIVGAVAAVLDIPVTKQQNFAAAIGTGELNSDIAGRNWLSQLQRCRLPAKSAPQ